MIKGERINGYRILRDFTTAGGGLSKWTFAEKAGREYFIKEFLQPTFPYSESPGSERVKARKLEACLAFEEHHRSLMAALSQHSMPGGNLIYTLDFFRQGAKYYKVTEKVDVTTLPPARIAKLALRQRMLIMTTIAHSLRILHRKDIVHGDLKPGNVLIKRTRMGSYTTKLIDFDDSYFSGRAPELSDDVVGDMVFYSPEMAAYILGLPDARREDLTTRSDIFALGLLYSLYLHGKLPDWDRKAYPYAWNAVSQGEKLRFAAENVPVAVLNLVGAMLHPVAGARPDIQEIFEQLKMQIAPPSARKKQSLKPFREELKDTGTLKGQIVDGETSASDAETPKPPTDSKLRGSLLNRKKD